MAGGATDAWPPSDLKGCHECSGEQNKNFHVVRRDWWLEETPAQETALRRRKLRYGGG
ncbi:hypothetical protein DBR06_SOUSAS18010037, partial [Sousa chinensis]